MLSIITLKEPGRQQLLSGVDVSDTRVTNEKPVLLQHRIVKSVKQSNQLKNPDFAIVFQEPSETPLLLEYAKGLAGVLNGDSNRFEAFFGK